MSVSPKSSNLPSLRLRLGNQAAVEPQGDFVLYWMTAFRRVEWNFSLQRAVEWAKTLGKPLVVFEALRCDYPWASDRLHQFIVQGMADNAQRLANRAAFYFPYLEPAPGAGRGLLAALAQRACVVVGDDFPCFFLPRMLQAAALRMPVRFEIVDSNGLLPMRAAEKAFSRAYDFRRFLQKTLLPHLLDFPAPHPLARARLPMLKKLPSTIQRQWPIADVVSLARAPNGLSRFPIDHLVAVAKTAGGTTAALRELRSFLKQKLANYAGLRNQPEQEATSGLSPFLHFGHISAHQVFDETMRAADWSPARVAEKPNGSAHNWWGVSESVEAFLDQLITWRELGYNMCSQRDDYARYESLPDWAQRTLQDHAADPRQFVYSPEELETSRTHDPLWNAAQRQLVREGKIHNYLRMLWGKKILEWSASPQEALAVMIDLNNKYALDGRNPNSYSGIFWVLGRYDRAWGPERPIYGKIRYMTSENTARKVRVKGYLAKYAAEES